METTYSQGKNRVLLKGFSEGVVGLERAKTITPAAIGTEATQL
jgi:hypothetical protein